VEISYLSSDRQVISPHRQFVPRQFREWNYRLTCAGGNRSPVIIIGLYKHKSPLSMLLKFFILSVASEMQSQYTLMVNPKPLGIEQMIPKSSRFTPRQISNQMPRAPRAQWPPDCWDR